MSDDIGDLANQYSDIPEKIEEKLHSLNISLPRIPKFNSGHLDIELTEEGEPIFPADVTNLDLEALGVLYNVCISYLNFVDNRLSFESTVTEAYRERMELIWSDKRKDYDGTKDDKNDNARTSPAFVRANREYEIQLGVENSLKKKFKQFERISSFLSREISRRQLLNEQEKNEIMAARKMDYLK